MSADRARLLREWFEAACDLPEREWAGFLQGCEDVPLRAEVLDLLQRDRTPGQPLDDPLLTAAQRGALLALAGDAPQPARIGPYEVVRVIGRGSMGTVYEARAPGDGTLVAIKVLRMGLPTRALLHRFRREAEILERLEHPCIARILQSGTTQVGLATLPFIAMELVSGRPLDQYCDEEQLDVRARLDLLAQVGEAVQHAHGRGVVHRDLKPSNILVDARGRPRLLDFGVARTTAAPGGPGSLHTATGQLVGTLQYMSPEQTLGDPSAVDARSDVYALGAIAYALLAGRPPYEVSGCSFDEALRRVRHEPPPPLDTLDRKLRGRVEVVVGRALEKERTDRYPSAQAFVDDLRALRDGRPSAARAPSLLQQLRRMARRDPRAFRAAAVFAGLLLLGSAGTTWGWLEARAQQRHVVLLLDQQRVATAEAEDTRAAAERSEAAAQAAWHESEAVVSFLDGMFGAVQPENQGPRALLVDVLLLAGPRVDEDLSEEPRLAARVHRILASAFFVAGRHERVLEHLDASDRLDAEPVALLSTRRMHAKILIAQGRAEEAVPLLEEVCARLPAEEAELRAMATGDLAHALAVTGDSATAVEHLSRLLGPDGHVPGVSVWQDESVRLGLARYAMDRGDLAAAEDTIRAVLQARSERLGPEHFATAEAASHLAGLLYAKGRVAEAEPLYALSAQVGTRYLGAEHPNALNARAKLAGLLVETGRAAEVLPELDEMVATCRRVLGNDHLVTADMLSMRGWAAFEAGRPDGLALCEEAVAVARTALGSDHPWLVGWLNHLGKAYMEEGRMEEGVAVMREAVAMCERNGLVRMNDQRSALFLLTVGLLKLGAMAEAHPVALQAVARSRETLGETHPQTIALTYELARTYIGSRDGEWRRCLLEDILRTATLAGDREYIILSRFGLGRMLRRLGELAEGEALMREALAEAEQFWDPDDPNTVKWRKEVAALPPEAP